MGNKLIAVALFMATAFAADPSADLLAEAVKGHTDQVEPLLASGANLEVQDKNGRTPLMLAAEHGHADTVRLLLTKGANAGARDRFGWTAYGLAYTAHHEQVFSALPPPAGLRLAVSSARIPEALISSCFMGLTQLIQHVDEMNLDSLILTAVQGIASAGPLRIVRAYRHGMAPVPESDALGDADAVLTLQLRPGSTCTQASGDEPSGDRLSLAGDSLSLAIDARMFRARDHLPIFKETFGGGLKGLSVRTVANPDRYFAIYQTWVNSHAGAMERSVLYTLLKTAP